MVTKYRFLGHVARQPAFPWQPFFAPVVGVGFTSSTKDKVDMNTQLCTFSCIRCDLVTLKPSIFWPKILSRYHGRVMNIYTNV